MTGSVADGEDIVQETLARAYAADDHESGTVVAVFPTVDDNFRYAVDMEGYGALQFFGRRKTSRSPC